MTRVSTAVVDVKFERADFPCYHPDMSEQRIYRDALAYLVFKWQLFAHMIYSDMNLEYSEFIPVAATNSKTIFLNPQGFIDDGITDVLEIVFVLAHEVYHRILYDLPMTKAWLIANKVVVSGGKELPYDHDLMGKAMDYRINASLVHSKIGRMPKNSGLYDETLSKQGMESCVEIYEKLWKRRLEFGGKKGGFDLHYQPNPKQVEAERGVREQAIIAAIQIAERNMPGTTPGNIKRILNEIVNPKVRWQDHLRSTMKRKAGPPKLDWRFPNRRLISRTPDALYHAKVGHRGAGLVAVVGDNSGSITPKVANIFGSEMVGIVKDLNPEQLIVFWCDAGITRVDIVDQPTDLNELFADWKTTGIGGGGGTNFNPPFQRLEEMGLEPDMLVYFTDGFGTFPHQEPPYPTIWASVSPKVAYPFGEVVHVEI